MSPENEKDLGFVLGSIKWAIYWWIAPFALMGIILAGIFVDAIIYGIVINIIHAYNAIIVHFH